MSSNLRITFSSRRWLWSQTYLYTNSSPRRFFFTTSRRHESWGKYRFDPEKAANAEPLTTHAVTIPLIIIALFGGITFYVVHLEDVPISGRTRFNCYSEESVQQEGAKAYRLMMQQCEGSILPDWDKRSMQVQRVMSRLIPASGMQNVAWRIHVIDSDDKNASVFPGGYVFVHSGILELTQTDDALAAILGHEIAHILAKHQAEKLSSIALLAIPRGILWFLDEAGYTYRASDLGDIALHLGMEMRSSREQEAEADHIGLMIMAKSCYDPSAAVGLWQRMQAWEKKTGITTPEWSSTHPDSTRRIRHISALLAKAEEQKAEAGCSGMSAFTDGFYDSFRAYSLSR